MKKFTGTQYICLLVRYRNENNLGKEHKIETKERHNNNQDFTTVKISTEKMFLTICNFLTNS